MNRLSPFAAVVGIAILLVVGAAMTSYFTVPAESVGVVLRFGKFNRESPPGLHGKLPFGLETVYLVPTERQLKLEFGFGTMGATHPEQVPGEPEKERLMVTGDLNAALVEWVVQYRIDDPLQFLFRIYRPEVALRAISESVMREVVGDRTIDEVLTFGRQEMEVEVLTKIQQACKEYELGVKIDQVQLKNVNPPGPVQASFDEVNRSQQEREQSINEARGNFNRVIPRARGEAEQQIREADGYALQRVNEAKGDAARFTSLLTEYRKAPEIMRSRVYLETMSKVLPKVGKKVIVDEGSTGNVVPWLPLGSPTAPSPVSNPPAAPRKLPQ